MLNIIIPNEASNKTTIGKINIILFGIVTIATLLRSMAHVFLPDGGANSIATLITFTENPDPDAVIHFVFSLWGLSQLLMGFFYILVLAKYRNLIPLMWVFILMEYSGRVLIGTVLKPLGEYYFVGTAPGEIGNYIAIPFALVMIIYSIYEATSKKSNP
jgi:hypothetical protein